MMLTLIKFFILGVGSSLLVLLAQTPFLSTTTQDTLQTLLLLTLIEETIRFFVLLVAYKRNIFPISGAFLSAALFGVGFALGEVFLSQGMAFAHILLVLCVHTFLSMLLFIGIRSKGLIPIALSYGSAIVLHMGYNTLFWFARF